MQLFAPLKDVVWEIVDQSHLFLSEDGGLSWNERVLTPVTLLFAAGIWSFSSARDGWLLVVYQPGTQCQQQDTELWHTTDGARSWSKVQPISLTTFQCKRSLTFVDSGLGFIAAADTTNAPSIHRTLDGGKTWSAASLPPPPDADTTTPGQALQPRGVKLFGSTAFVIADGFTSTGAVSSYLFVSVDSGATWAYIGPWGTAQYMVTATRWLRFLRPYQESTDAGATWHGFATDYVPVIPDALPALLFADANVGYLSAPSLTATGASTVSTFRTSDGGAHWTFLQPPVGTQTP